MEPPDRNQWPESDLTEEQWARFQAAFEAYPELRGELVEEGIPGIITPAEGDPEESYIDAQRMAERVRAFQTTIAAMGANTLVRIFNQPGRPPVQREQLEALARDTTQLREFQRSLCLNHDLYREQDEGAATFYATVLYLRSPDRGKWYGGAQIAVFTTPDEGDTPLISQGLPADDQRMLKDVEDYLLGPDLIPGGTDTTSSLTSEKHGSWPPSENKPNNSLPHPNYQVERETACKPRLNPDDIDPVTQTPKKYFNNPKLRLTAIDANRWAGNIENLDPEFAVRTYSYRAGMEIKQGWRGFGSGVMLTGSEVANFEQSVTTDPILDTTSSIYATFTMNGGNLNRDPRRVVGVVISDELEQLGEIISPFDARTFTWKGSDIEEALNEKVFALSGRQPAYSEDYFPGFYFRAEGASVADPPPDLSFNYDGIIPQWVVTGRIVSARSADLRTLEIKVPSNSNQALMEDRADARQLQNGLSLVTTINGHPLFGELTVDNQWWREQYYQQRDWGITNYRSDPYFGWARSINDTRPQAPMTLQDWAVVEVLRVRGFFDPVPVGSDRGRGTFYQSEEHLREAEGASTFAPPFPNRPAESLKWVWIKVKNTNLCVDSKNLDNFNWGLTDDLMTSKLYRYPNSTVRNIPEDDPNCERRQRLEILKKGGNWIPPTQKVTEAGTIWCIPFYFLTNFATSEWNAIDLCRNLFTLQALEPAWPEAQQRQAIGQVRRRLSTIQDGICSSVDLQGKDICDLSDPMVNFCIKNATDMVCPCDSNSELCSNMCREFVNNYWNGKCRCNVRTWLDSQEDQTSEVFQKVDSDYDRLENILSSCGSTAEECISGPCDFYSTDAAYNSFHDEMTSACYPGGTFTCTADCKTFFDNRWRGGDNCRCSTQAVAEKDIPLPANLPVTYRTGDYYNFLDMHDRACHPDNQLPPRCPDERPENPSNCGSLGEDECQRMQDEGYCVWENGMCTSGSDLNESTCVNQLSQVCTPSTGINTEGGIELLQACAQCYGENQDDLVKNYGCSSDIASAWCSGVNPNCSSVRCPNGWTNVSDPNQVVDWDSKKFGYGCCVQSCSSFECPAGTNSKLDPSPNTVPIENRDTAVSTCCSSNCENIGYSDCISTPGCRYVNNQCKSECPVTKTDGAKFHDDDIQGYFRAPQNKCSKVDTDIMFDADDRANCARFIEIGDDGKMYHCKFDDGWFSESCKRDVEVSNEMDLVFIKKDSAAPGHRFLCNSNYKYGDGGAVDSCTGITDGSVCNSSWDRATGERCEYKDSDDDDVFSCRKKREAVDGDLEDNYARDYYLCTYEPRSC
jgi:hypothetical protein